MQYCSQHCRKRLSQRSGDSARIRPGMDSIPYSNKEEREFVSGQIDAIYALKEEKTCYLRTASSDQESW